jgi:hypothetical protein
MKQNSAFTERSVCPLISPLHSNKLSRAPLVLDNGCQEVPDGEFWPENICKIDTAARYLEHNRTMEFNNAVSAA